MTPNNSWKIVGASVIGAGHIANELPCQDAHAFTCLAENTGIAVVCDGAGSCENAHLGAQFVAQNTLDKVQELAKDPVWLHPDQAPQQETWLKAAKHVVEAVQKELREYAQEMDVTYKSLSCTLIVLLFAPHRLLLFHIGDGRAGYAGFDGVWKSALTPFKGDQVGETVFITSDVGTDLKNQWLQAHIIHDAVLSFALLSDGCERACWLCYDKIEHEDRYFDPNTPSQDFFSHNTEALKTMHSKGVSREDMQEKWTQFLQDGNAVLKTEPDDKTLILGCLMDESTTE